MSRVKEYEKLRDEINKYFLDSELIKMTLLSFIAENTAIIADSVNKKEGEQNDE